MSSVELPRVASARSAGSSAASSRGNTHSAGSTESERSQPHDALDVTLDDEYADEDEEPQETSGQGLWDQVEHFLSKPSPSLSTLRGPPASKPQSKTSTTRSTSGVLPSLNARQAAVNNQSARPSRPARAPGVAGGKPIDPQLLQEAFAYAQRVQQLNLDDDDASQQSAGRRVDRPKAPSLARTRSSSSSLGGKKPGSSSSSGSGGGDTRKSGKTSVYNSAVKPGGRHKKRVGGRVGGRGRGEPESRTSAKSKGHMDPQTLQELVSNFQHGTALDELRKELAASQQSMAASRQVLQDAAQSFFQAT